MSHYYCHSYYYYHSYDYSLQRFQPRGTPKICWFPQCPTSRQNNCNKCEHKREEITLLWTENINLLFQKDYYGFLIRFSYVPIFSETSFNSKTLIRDITLFFLWFLPYIIIDDSFIMFVHVGPTFLTFLVQLLYYESQKDSSGVLPRHVKACLFKCKYLKGIEVDKWSFLPPKDYTVNKAMKQFDIQITFEEERWGQLVNLRSHKPITFQHLHKVSTWEFWFWVVFKKEGFVFLPCNTTKSLSVKLLSHPGHCFFSSRVK